MQGKDLLKANCYGPYISDVLSFNREFIRLWLLVEINCAPFRPFPSPCFVKLPSVRRLHNWTKKLGTPFFARFDWKSPFEIYRPLCRATWSGINISNLHTCTEISWDIKINFFASFCRKASAPVAVWARTVITIRVLQQPNLRGEKLWSQKSNSNAEQARSVITITNKVKITLTTLTRHSRSALVGIF